MIEAINVYCYEVLRFRKALNLTSISNMSEFIRRFVEPSLALAEWLPAKGRLLDVGSGMGIPGVPLLLSNPDLHGILVERRKKRAEFLRHLVRLLDLKAEVIADDALTINSQHVDACVARAVADQINLLEIFSRHANNGARAAFPVPLSSQIVDVENWRLVGERVNMAGRTQLIRCYEYCNK